MDDNDIAVVAKALSHPARLHIVRLLAHEPECRGADLFADLPLAQSTVSQHLAVLGSAGVVVSHSVGQGRVYCLAPGTVRSFCEEVSSIVANVQACSIESEESS